MNVWVRVTTATIMVTASILRDLFYVLATMGILEMEQFVKVNIISCFEITVSQTSSEITPCHYSMEQNKPFNEIRMSLEMKLSLFLL